MATFDPLPTGDPLVDKKGNIFDTWIQWLQKFVTRVMTTPSVLSPVIDIETNASIAASDAMLIKYDGIYRLTNFVQILVPASVSHSLTVTFSWVTNGVNQTATSAAITGNTTTTRASGTLMTAIDANTLVTYETTYAPVGVPGTYEYGLVVESVSI